MEKTGTTNSSWGIKRYTEKHEEVGRKTLPGRFRTHRFGPCFVVISSCCVGGPFGKLT